MKKTRRAARELALNILYQAGSCGVPFDEALETAKEFVDLTGLRAKNAEKADDVRAYADLLARGVYEHQAELDSHISRLAQDWPVDRQPAVDRNILRMAIFEIDHVDSVPPIVAVDEAVEMAKKFSTAESGKFVNGVLAAYLKEKAAGEEEIG
ncbi:transcription antitermination factor NusB [bacterium]|nr:transcription antitermination factor NusB [bacterium]